MCKTIFVRATLGDGETPYPDAPEELVFESPSNFTAQKPTCTCYIGDRQGEGKVLRQAFVEECLQPLLEKVSWGNIVIELR